MNLQIRSMDPLLKKKFKAQKRNWPSRAPAKAARRFRIRCLRTRMIRLILVRPSRLKRIKKKKLPMLKKQLMMETSTLAVIRMMRMTMILTSTRMIRKMKLSKRGRKMISTSMRI